MVRLCNALGLFCGRFMGYCRQAGKARAKLPRIVCAIKGRRQSIQRRRKGYGRQAAGYDGQLVAAGFKAV